MLLYLISKLYPNKIHIIQLDNRPAHQNLSLSIPDQIILLFQLSYCPEVIPILKSSAILKTLQK